MMEAGPVVHWFLRERCNLDCIYCFGPRSSERPVGENDLALARILTESGVGKVVLGGGEPMLADTLDSVVKILKEGGVSVSLHTNGTLLTRERLQQWRGLVDDIALPVDAVKREIQEQLRGPGFMGVFDRMRELVDWINERGIEVGYHTVSTRRNWRQIPQIYRRVDQQPFEYWRIYEYNPDLPRGRFLRENNGRRMNPEDLVVWNRIQNIDKLGTMITGQTDGSLARLLLMEEEMQQRHGDQRVRFVLGGDTNGYLFLANSGEMGGYGPYSLDERSRLGNIMEVGLPTIRQNLDRLLIDEVEMGTISDRDWHFPFWLRQWLGSCWEQEFDKVDWDKYGDKMKHLVNLWETRQGGFVNEDK